MFFGELKLPNFCGFGPHSNERGKSFAMVLPVQSYVMGGVSIALPETNLITIEGSSRHTDTVTSEWFLPLIRESFSGHANGEV